MIATITTLILACCLAAPSSLSASQVAPPSQGDLVAPWREDLRFLAEQLPKNHVNLFFSTPKAKFDEAVAALDRDLHTLNRDQILVRFIELAAMFNDGHTAVATFNMSPPLTSYPATFYWFPDGIRVSSISAEYRDALGARIVAVGGVPIDEAIARITPTISAENQIAILNGAPLRLAQVEIMRGLGLAGDEGLRLTVQTVDGSRRELVLRPLPAAVDLFTLPDASRAPRPLYRTDARNPYWYHLLEKEHTLYIQYASCVSDPRWPFAQFAQEVLAEIDRHSVKKVVIDLRRNSGGNSSIVSPLLSGLRSNKTINASGHLFVLIGRTTFSSAMSNALGFRRATRAILVGEPNSEHLNSYGEVRSFLLPNSKLPIQYSTRFYKLVQDDPGSLQPDLSVPLTFADFAAGIDPVLNRAIQYVASKRP